MLVDCCPQALDKILVFNILFNSHCLKKVRKKNLVGNRQVYTPNIVYTINDRTGLAAAVAPKVSVRD